jgi:predicted O-methyltransferase YrrM
MAGLILGIKYLHHKLVAFFSRQDDFIRAFRSAISVVNGPGFILIEQYRAELLARKDIARNFHFGAGSRKPSDERTIGTVAKLTSVNAHYGKILYYLTSRFKPDTVIELGTALGISTLYLSLGYTGAKVYTIEGNPQLAGIAAESFKKYGLSNISVLNDGFDQLIDSMIDLTTGNTLVFIDGNHTFDATMRYFKAFGKCKGSIIMVFDDIRWSGDMNRAWKEIKELSDTGVTIDLFKMGIIISGHIPVNRKYTL